MEEIKFRVYDKEEKCFHYFTLANILQYKNEFEKHIINGDKFDLFTGLHDMSGREVFEDDIYYEEELDLYHVVKFCDGEFRFYCKNGYDRILTHLNRNKYRIDLIYKGNSFENPELIKEVE